VVKCWLRSSLFSRARSYDVRYAPAPAGGGTPTTWTTATFASARTAVSIGGLTPGTNYLFQVRRFRQAGHTDWSDSVARICAWEERLQWPDEGRQDASLFLSPRRLEETDE